MQLPSRLLRRKKSAHKGDFGHIFILAGSGRYSGAGVLCAHAALRAGAGLVTLGIPKGLNSSLIKIKPLEIMTLTLAQTKEETLSLAAFPAIKEFAKKADILAIGPGLSQNKSTQALVRKVVAQIHKPMVIDADGLNALVGHLDVLRIAHSVQRTTLITPHPGEMSRLLGVSVGAVQKNRLNLAKTFAKKHKVVVVLKGFHTIVTDGLKAYINKTGNPGMSTAGSGDVLTGMIAAFLGQGLSGFDAAKYAVYLHGKAGDSAAREKTQVGLIASDIIEEIPKAIKLRIKN